MKITRKELEELFNRIKLLNPQLENLGLISSDGRIGKLVALGYYRDGSLYVKTEYYTYNEMVAFLDGIAFNK